MSVVIASRPYRSPDDTLLLQDFTLRAIAAADQTGHLHPGDVAHHIHTGLRHEDPTGLVEIWEDAAGVAGWALVSPSHRGFDAQVRPELRTTHPELEREILVWSEQRLREVLVARGVTDETLFADAFGGDDVRISHLEELGWRRAATSPYVLTLRSLAEVSDVVLPAGYTIRTAAGLDEAEKIGEVHAAAFGSTWHPGQYRTLMETPSYDLDREVLAVAPDGALAAFAVLWFDEVNRVGLFEPVGVHPDHQRLGLGTAVMAEGMRLMRRAGMTHGMVTYEADNPGSGPLYRGMGFVPTWHLIDYTKPLSPGS